MDGMRLEKQSMAFALCHNHSTPGKIRPPKFGFSPLLTADIRRYPADYDYPVRYQGPSRESFEHMEDGLSRLETIELFRDAVETARQGIQQSLAGSERVVEAVNPKLTVDLSHQYIEKIPEAVVDILKPDVQMYESAPSTNISKFETFLKHLELQYHIG